MVYFKMGTFNRSLNSNMSTRGWTAVRLPEKLNREEAFIWCYKNFGKPGFLSDRRWAPLEFTIQFRDKKDAMWFKIKWG
jgi:hypothetical protein